ncbi:phosphoribosylanthranilate isomerase [Castellaniella caeni]|uniref:phosphoribosylanthranilate isomerase n=1 Tax=Castellaniella caeni TaxID=266123 RepID=UPI0008331EDA|nr:phosphoribosylanthranilate isomerase [Castellaniella caeni]
MKTPGRTRIKVCGLTRPGDVAAAVDLGVDALGLVFYPPSRRALSLDHAAALRRQVPAFVSTVALFVNPSVAEVEQVLARVRPDLLQFHGEEPPRFCAQFGVPYLKAFRVGAPGLDSAANLLAQCRLYDAAGGWLFDSYSAGYGGSGLSFDAALLAAVRGDAQARPVVLSGGLTAETVGQGIAAVRPFAVDVSSGVESAPGIKDADRIAAFVAAVRASDCT